MICKVDETIKYKRYKTCVDSVRDGSWWREERGRGGVGGGKVGTAANDKLG